MNTSIYEPVRLHSFKCLMRFTSV